MSLRNVELEDEQYKLANFIQSLPTELHPYIRRPISNIIPLYDRNRGVIKNGFRKTCGIILAPYIAIRNVLVKDKELALIWDNGKALIYGPGRHALFSPTTRLVQKVNINTPLIEHGTMTIVRVEIGQLGYGINTESGDPVILSPGKHFIDSDTFRFKEFIDITKSSNKIGKLLLIRVETGNVGIVYRNGQLDILYPGKLHLVSPPDRYDGLVSTQQRSLDLPKSIHESSDYVELSITASLFYRVKDPKKALENIQDIELQVKETAIATLAGIIRSTSLTEIAQNTTPVYKKTIEQPNKFGLKAPPFYQKVHDMFLQELHDYVLEDWGIEINNIRIESLKINDTRLAKDIAQNAITVSQMDVKYNMLQKQSEITETEARMKANANKIDAEGNAKVLLEKTRAEIDSNNLRADGEAKVLERKTQAEIESLIKIADAKKQAKILEGEGEKSYIDNISSNKYGPLLAQMNLQKDAVKGIQQIAYLPSGCVPKILTQGMFSDNEKFSIPEIK